MGSGKFIFKNQNKWQGLHKKLLKSLKQPWPYWIGGLLLGLMNVILLALLGFSWQITSSFLLWGVGVLEWFGLDPLSWEYFNHFQYFYQPITLRGNIFFNEYSLLVLGIVFGSLLVTLLASQFKFKKIKDKKQFFMALIGGLMMGYGTRLAGGCNIGAFFSGIPSLSLHGWIFGIFLFLGTGFAIKYLIRFIL